MSTAARAHPLFRTYPLRATCRTSAGDAPTPYHIYDGLGFLVGATADGAAVQNALATEQVAPILTTSGRALAAIWFIRADDASHGPHAELQVSVAVTQIPLPPVADHPLALLALLVQAPEARLLCWGLWNDTAAVVAYNRERLGLPAQRMTARFDERGSGAGRRVRVDCRSSEGDTLAAADLRLLRRSSGRAGRSLARLIGWSGAWALARRPWQQAQVTSPLSGGLAHNADAQTYIAGDSIAVDLWSAEESCSVDAPVCAGWELRPQFIECFSGLRFVYLNPHNVGDAARVDGPK